MVFASTNTERTAGSLREWRLLRLRRQPLSMPVRDQRLDGGFEHEDQLRAGHVLPLAIELAERILPAIEPCFDVRHRLALARGELDSRLYADVGLPLHFAARLEIIRQVRAPVRA